MKTGSIYTMIYDVFLFIGCDKLYIVYVIFKWTTQSCLKYQFLKNTSRTKKCKPQKFLVSVFSAEFMAIALEFKKTIFLSILWTIFIWWRSTFHCQMMCASLFVCSFQYCVINLYNFHWIRRARFFSTP